MNERRRTKRIEGPRFPAARAALAILGLALASVAHGQGREPKARLTGYIKELQTVSFVDDAASLTTSNLLHNRLNFRWDPCSTFFVRVEVRNRLFYGEQIRLTPGFGDMLDTQEGLLDLGALWLDEQALVLHSVADRALAGWSSGRWAVTAGRQRINWGINTVWNPNDLFNAYDFLDFDYEERGGTDALRVQYFSGSSSAEAAWMPSRKRYGSIAAALVRTNRWSYDWQVLGGVCRDDAVAGLGWAGHINDVGFKGEASAFRKLEAFSGSPTRWTGSVGWDYTFGNAWYVSLAGLYVSDPATGLLAASPSAVRPVLTASALMPYRYSVHASVSKTLNPLLTLQAAVVAAPDDRALIVFPSLAWSAAQDVTIDLTAQSFFADATDGFRTVGNGIFTRIRWSF